MGAGVCEFADKYDLSDDELEKMQQIASDVVRSEVSTQRLVSFGIRRDDHDEWLTYSLEADGTAEDIVDLNIMLAERLAEHECSASAHRHLNVRICSAISR